MRCGIVVRIGFSLLLLLTAAGAAAHELFFAETPSGLVAMRGHLAADEAHGEGAAPCPAEVFVWGAVVDTVGAVTAAFPAMHPPAAWPAGAAAVALEISSGCWTKTPAGTVNLPRNEADSPLESWHSREGLKRITVWSPHLTEPIDGRPGAGLEISPCADPFVRGKGDKLSVCVTYGSEPVAGAIVLYDGRPRGATGAGGLTNIRLRHDGPQHISASWTLEKSCEAYDRVVATAVLEFETEKR